MNVEFKRDENCIIATIYGEIDHHIAKQMRESIDMYVQKYDPEILYLDFANVDFMDSSGIGLILGRYQMMKERCGKLFLVNVSKYLEKLIILGGLGQLNIIKNHNKEGDR